MNKSVALKAARHIGLAAALAAGWATGAALAAEIEAEQSPTAVAHQFLRAFEKKDWATLRTLFAPNAVVSTVNLAREGAPAVDYVTAAEWMTRTEAELAPVTEIAITLLDTSVLSFDQGAIVAVRFRSAGKLGDKASFTNDGIDTYSLTQLDGAWRILRYGTFELLEFR